MGTTIRVGSGSKPGGGSHTITKTSGTGVKKGGCGCGRK